MAPRTDIPPRPVAPVQPPISPLSQVRREKSRKREIIAKEIPPPPTVREREKMVPPAFEVQEGQLPSAPPPIFKAPAETYAGVTPTIAKAEGPRADVARLLASTSGLRGAIILREILGTTARFAKTRIYRNLARAGSEARLTGRTPVLHRRRGGIGRRAGLKIQ